MSDYIEQARWIVLEELKREATKVRFDLKRFATSAAGEHILYLTSSDTHQKAAHLTEYQACRDNAGLRRAKLAWIETLIEHLEQSAPVQVEAVIQPEVVPIT